MVITGTGFTNVTSVTFGGQPTNFLVDSSTKIRAIAPQVGTSGTVDVVVTTTSGSSATSDATKYSYGVPVITKLDPSWGPIEGGNLVSIEGSGFVNVTAVKFGNTSVTFNWILVHPADRGRPGWRRRLHRPGDGDGQRRHQFDNGHRQRLSLWRGQVRGHPRGHDYPVDRAQPHGRRSVRHPCDRAGYRRPHHQRLSTARSR